MRRLVYDIETSYNIVQYKTFQLIPKSIIPIHHDSIIQERNILTASWIWKGEKKPHSISVNPKKPTHDRHIVEMLYHLFSEADEIIAHYGDKFDARYIRGRGFIHGLKPPPPVKQVDTYKIAKSRLNLNSNKLDYLGKVLGLGGKIETDHTLWDRCMEGEPKAIREMVRYNEQDVTLLDKVHDRLEPYAASSYVLMRENCCPYCGSKNLHSRGTMFSNVRKYKRYQCLDCRRWPRKAA